MRTITIVAIMMALLPAIAHAQLGGPKASSQSPRQSTTPFDRTPEEKRQDAAVDKEYQATLKADRERAAPTKIDPWQTIRPAGANNAKQ
jgi:hypothetical protein